MTGFIIFLDYLLLPKFFLKNQESLEELCAKENGNGQLPCYTVKGDAMNKNINMSRLMAQVLECFSKENDVSQRLVVEGALVEYFRHYGCEYVESILNRNGNGRRS